MELSLLTDLTTYRLFIIAIVFTFLQYQVAEMKELHK